MAWHSRQAQGTGAAVESDKGKTRAQVVPHCGGSSDLFVRYGGEEFLVMLPETGLQQADLVARRLADSVRRTLFSVDPPIRGMTVRIGVTALRDADDGLESVLGRIDKAAYRAKALGPDRTELMP